MSWLTSVVSSQSTDSKRQDYYGAQKALAQAVLKTALFACVCAMLTLGAGCASVVPDAQSGYSLTFDSTGQAFGGIGVVYPWRIQDLPNGSLIIANFDSTGMPVAVDGSGRLMRLGSRGSGPGEFERPDLLDVSGDEVLLADLASDRLTTMSASTGATVRSFRTFEIGPVREGVMLRGDTIVVAKPVYSDRRFGLPLHLVTSRGGVLRSFGNEDRSVDASFRYKDERILAADTDSSFWCGRLDRYLIQLWSISGELLRTLEPQRAWFPPMSASPEPVFLSRPETSLMSVQKDVFGNLVVLLRRARSDWKPDSSLMSQVLVQPQDIMLFVEEVVEILDPRDGHLIASGVHRGEPMLGALAGGRMYGLHQDSTGVQVPVVWFVNYPRRR